MSEVQVRCPNPLSDMVSTSVVRSRSGGPSYVVVTLDERMTNVGYTVYPTVSDGEPVSGFCLSGKLHDKFKTEGHSFVFPVEKKTLYFIVLSCNVEDTGVEHEDVKVTWLMDPFKRRQVSRKDVAPAEVPAATDAPHVPPEKKSKKYPPSN